MWRLILTAATTADFCDGKSNGDYVISNGQSSYYRCVSQTTYIRHCPQGLIFEQPFPYCDWPATTTATPTNPITSKDFCIGKTDGDYANPTCPNCYYSCVSQLTYLRHCQQGLVYKQPLPLCVWPTTTPTKTSPMTTTTSPTNPNTSEDPNFCVGRTDGDYANTNYPNCYYSCSGGTTYFRRCQKGLNFNQKEVRCVWPIKTPTKPTKTSPMTTTTTPTNPNTSEDPNFCVGRTDGDYANTNYPNCYYSCSGGTTYFRRCQKGLNFNQKEVRCDWPIKTPTKPTKTSPMTTTTSTTSPTNHNTSEDPNFCVGRTDGDYANTNDQNRYYSCSGGITYFRRCQKGLNFNQKEVRCVWPIKTPT